MDLVDDDHLVAITRGAVFEALGQLADLLDLGVGGGIHLDDIHVGATGDLAADNALVAGTGGETFLAIQGLGQHAGHARLADTTDAGEEIGLGDTAFAQGVAQRDDDRLLADHAGEILRAPLAGENLIGHR